MKNCKLFFRKLYNLSHFHKWTDCEHKKWKPLDFIDWECVACGAWTDNMLEANRYEGIE